MYAKQKRKTNYHNDNKQSLKLKFLTNKKKMFDHFLFNDQFKL